MQIEIRFRGKRIDNGKWVYGYYLVKAEKHIIYSRGDIQSFEVIPESVGQFIGLKDKAGNDIYQGDIVEGYWGWLKGDGRIKNGYPKKIRKWFEVRYSTRKYPDAGWDLHEICVHPEDRFASEKYFYRSILSSLREDRECELKDNEVVWLGKCNSLEIIGNIYEKQFLNDDDE